MECLNCRHKIGKNSLTIGVHICAQEHILCNNCAHKNRQRCVICGDAELTEYFLNSKPAGSHDSAQTLISLRRVPGKTCFWDNTPTQNSSVKLQDSENSSEIQVLLPHDLTAKYWKEKKIEVNRHEALQRITDDVLQQLNNKESKCIEELVKRNVEKYMNEILGARPDITSKSAVITAAVPVIETDYTVLTSSCVPTPVCAEKLKPKCFGLDQQMQTVYEAIKECSTPLNETEFVRPIFENKWREMHIPTAPAMETDSSLCEPCKPAAQIANAKCTLRRLGHMAKQLISVPADCLSDNDAAATAAENQTEWKSLENIKQLKQSSAKMDLINAMESSTETELESSDCASEIIKKEIRFIKPRNEEYLDKILNKILESTKLNMEVCKRLDKNQKTFMVQVSDNRNESLESLKRKRYAAQMETKIIKEKLLSAQTAKVNSLTDISEATDKDSTGQKSASTDTFVLKQEQAKQPSEAQWKTIEHPNIGRVLYNPKRLLICALHGYTPCRCDFKLLGKPAMLQAITTLVRENQNYKLKMSKQLRFNELTMLHNPLKCPVASCEKTIFLSDISRHLILYHTELLVLNVQNGERVDFELELNHKLDNVPKVQQVFMVSGKICEMGSSQFKNALPLLLMTARLKLSTLADWQISEGTVPFKCDEDYFLVWISGVTACELRPTYTFATWRYKHMLPLCHLSNSTHIISMRHKLKPIDIYHTGKALLLSPNELNMLTDCFSKKLQCQLVVH